MRKKSNYFSSVKGWMVKKFLGLKYAYAAPFLLMVLSVCGGEHPIEIAKPSGEHLFKGPESDYQHQQEIQAAEKKLEEQKALQISNTQKPQPIDSTIGGTDGSPSQTTTGKTPYSSGDTIVSPVDVTEPVTTDEKGNIDQAAQNAFIQNGSPTVLSHGSTSNLPDRLQFAQMEFLKVLKSVSELSSITKEYSGKDLQKALLTGEMLKTVQGQIAQAPDGTAKNDFKEVANQLTLLVNDTINNQFIECSSALLVAYGEYESTKDQNNSLLSVEFRAKVKSLLPQSNLAPDPFFNVVNDFLSLTNPTLQQRQEFLKQVNTKLTDCVQKKDSLKDTIKDSLKDDTMTRSILNSQPVDQSLQTFAQAVNVLVQKMARGQAQIDQQAAQAQAVLKSSLKSSDSKNTKGVQFATDSQGGESRLDGHNRPKLEPLPHSSMDLKDLIDYSVDDLIKKVQDYDTLSVENKMQVRNDVPFFIQEVNNILVDIEDAKKMLLEKEQTDENRKLLEQLEEKGQKLVDQQKQLEIFRKNGEASNALADANDMVQYSVGGLDDLVKQLKNYDQLSSEQQAKIIASATVMMGQLDMAKKVILTIKSELNARNDATLKDLIARLTERYTAFFDQYEDLANITKNINSKAVVKKLNEAVGQMQQLNGRQFAAGDLEVVKQLADTISTSMKKFTSFPDGIIKESQRIKDFYKVFEKCEGNFQKLSDLMTQPDPNKIREKYFSKAIEYELREAAKSEDTGDLLPKMKQALDAFKAGNTNSVITRLVDDFEKSYPGQFQDVQNIASVLDVRMQTFTDAIKSRDALDRSSIEYQQADQKVQELLIALEGMIRIGEVIHEELLATQSDFFDSIESVDASDAIEALRENLTMRQTHLSYRLEEAHKSLITQQAKDFLHDTQAMKDIVDSQGTIRLPESRNLIELSRLLESWSLQDFSLEESLKIVTDPAIKKSLEQVASYRQKGLEFLRSQSLDKAHVYADIAAGLASDGLQVQFNKKYDFNKKILDDLKFAVSSSEGDKQLFQDAKDKTVALLDSTKNQFAQVQEKAQKLLKELQTSGQVSMDQLITSFTLDRSGNGVDEKQNALYEALTTLRGLAKQMDDLAQSLASIATEGSTSSKSDLTAGIKDRLGSSFEFENDGASGVKEAVEKLISPTYALEEINKSGSQLGQKLLEGLGRTVLELKDDVKVAKDTLILSSFEAARIKKIVENMDASQLPSSLPIDWRILPKTFLEELGRKWIDARKNSELSFQEKKVLCDSWTFGLKESGQSDQPFRNIGADIFADPLAEYVYLGVKPEGLGIGIVSEFGRLLDSRAGDYTPQQFEKVFDDYQLLTQKTSWQARTAIEYVKTIELGMALFGQEGGLTASDLPSLVSDIASFQNSLNFAVQQVTGADLQAQKSLVARSEALKDAATRVVTAQEIQKELARNPSDIELRDLKKILLQDLQTRLTKMDETLSSILKKVRTNAALTPEEMQNIHIYRSTELLEKELYTVLQPQEGFDSIKDLLSKVFTEEESELKVVLGSDWQLNKSQIQAPFIQDVQKRVTAFSVPKSDIARWQKLQKGTLTLSADTFNTELATISEQYQTAKDLLVDLQRALDALKKSPQDKVTTDAIKSLQASQVRLTQTSAALDSYKTFLERTDKITKTKELFDQGKMTAEVYRNFLNSNKDLPAGKAALQEFNATLQNAFSSAIQTPEMQKFVKNPMSYLTAQFDSLTALFDKENTKPVQTDDKLQQIEKDRKQLEDLLDVVSAVATSSKSLAFEKDAMGKILSSDDVKLLMISELGSVVSQFPLIAAKLNNKPVTALLLLPREDLLQLQQAKEKELNEKRIGNPELQQVRDFGHVLKTPEIFTLFARKMAGNPLLVDPDKALNLVGKINEKNKGMKEFIDDFHEDEHEDEDLF